MCETWSRVTAKALLPLRQDIYQTQIICSENVAGVLSTSEAHSIYICAQRVEQSLSHYCSSTVIAGKTVHQAR